MLDLDGIPHSRIAIPNEPGQSAMLDFDSQRSFAITDVKYYKGEVFVTGVSNQRFASTLHRIPYPFNGRVATSTVEIWPPVHSEFETRARSFASISEKSTASRFFSRFTDAGRSYAFRFPR